MPLFSPGFAGRRRETSARTACRYASHRARRPLHRPWLRAQVSLGPDRRRTHERIRTGSCGPNGRSRPRRTRRTDAYRAVKVAPYPADDLTRARISRPGPAVLRGEPDLIGGSEARVDFVYTRRVPADCPRPAGRLTRADLPVHHRLRSRRRGPRCWRGRPREVKSASSAADPPAGAPVGAPPDAGDVGDHTLGRTASISAPATANTRRPTSADRRIPRARTGFVAYPGIGDAAPWFTA